MFGVYCFCCSICCLLYSDKRLYVCLLRPVTVATPSSGSSTGSTAPPPPVTTVDDSEDDDDDANPWSHTTLDAVMSLGLHLVRVGWLIQQSTNLPDHKDFLLQLLLFPRLEILADAKITRHVQLQMSTLAEPHLHGLMRLCLDYMTWNCFHLRVLLARLRVKVLHYLWEPNSYKRFMASHVVYKPWYNVQILHFPLLLGNNLFMCAVGRPN